jgi:PAS domain S-box-containing protein
MDTRSPTRASYVLQDGGEGTSVQDELNRVVDALPGLVWTALADGEVDFLNQRWCEYTGLTAGELSGRGWRIAVHPEDLPGLLEWWRTFVASGAPGETGARLRRFDGAYRRFVMRACPLADASGRIIKWCGIHSDVEEFKGTEVHLHAGEADFHSIADSIPALISVMTSTGEVESVNRHTLEYFGVALGELKQWSAGTGVVHPDDLPAVVAAWMRSVETGEPYDIEHRMRRADGAYRWFHVRGLPLKDDDGRITRWCVLQSDIDDQKRAEEELRASETNLRQILDGIPGFVCTLSPAGQVDLPNQRFLEYFGRTLEEVNAWSTNDLVHPDDLPRVTAEVTRSFATGTPYDSELRYRRADGVYRWFQVRILPVRDTEGTIARWCGLITDIEDRKQAEQELRRSEARKTAILDSALDCVVTIDHQGRITEFNPAAERVFGYRRDEAVGKHLADVIIPPSLREQHRAGFARYLATGEARVLGKHIELTAMRADGSEFPVELAISRIAMDGPPSFTGYLRDITERKQAEEELQRSEAFLAEGQRLSRTGSFSWRLDTGEIRWSEQVYRIFELDSDFPVTLDLIGSRVHPEDHSLMQDMAERAQAGKDFEYEHRLQLPDNRVKYLHLMAHGTRTSAGQFEYIGAVQDVTERRLSEEVLSKLRSELAHMSRITSLGALTASIAHEVNQPLSGIVTNASTCLRMLSADPPNVDGALETARRTIRDGNRAADVITRLRALFSKKDVAIEPIDLNEATREVVAISLSELQRNRVILRTELVDDLPSVLGDRVQLQQVILNLMRNASDAMSGVEDRPRQLAVRTERDGDDAVRMVVQDSGIGIDPRNIDRLFDAFYTTKSAGMGMGLSVSRSIIESHHGRLWAAPNDGPGTAFSFSIPRAPEGATGAGNLDAIQASAMTDTQNDTRNP